MVKKVKLIWKVDEKPTGRYASFEKRSWPTAFYQNGEYAASISCEDAYNPRDAKEGKHKPLILRLANYSIPSNLENNSGWTMVRAKKEFATLKELKLAAIELLEKNPYLMGSNRSSPCLPLPK